MSEWQPIETAPKDKTKILLYPTSARIGPRTQVGYWHQPQNPDHPGFWTVAKNPTHWMPLPEPPKDALK